MKKNFLFLSILALAVGFLASCKKGATPIAPISSTLSTVKVNLPSNQSHASNGSNPLSYDFYYLVTGSGEAPVTGTIGPIAGSTIGSTYNFTVNLTSTNYNYIAVQVNDAAAQTVYAIGAEGFTFVPGTSLPVTLAPIHVCYIVNNLAPGNAYGFENNTTTYVGQNTSTGGVAGLDMVCNFNTGNTGYLIENPVLTGSTIAYMGNGLWVNDLNVPPSSYFCPSSGASKGLVTVGNAGAPNNYPAAVGDIYCVHLLAGGYAWLQVTSVTGGLSFVFRPNTTLSYCGYELSAIDAAGGCNVNVTSTYTATYTPGVANTSTPTVTSSFTNTPGGANTSTYTPTSTSTTASTATSTNTNTSTSTLVSTATLTPTNTNTATSTYSSTSQSTYTPTTTTTNTSTNTSTNTATNTSTSTLGSTSTSTATNTSTNTATSTNTGLSTSTATSTNTNTSTSTPTNTETNTPTSTGTGIYTYTPTPSNTATNTATNTSTNTSTSTVASTSTSTNTNTSTSTNTPTSTGTATSTSNSTSTVTASNTPTATSTSTNTATNTATPTSTGVSTYTATQSSTNTSTSTPTNTATATSTSTNTNTSTSTALYTATYTPSNTNTATNTSTNTATNTNTSTSTSQSTATNTVTFTYTTTPSFTPTPGLNGGVVTTFAGTGISGSLNSSAATSTFYWPTGVAVDASGNVYVADYSNDLIRMISGGNVTTLAGGGGGIAVGAYADGLGTAASFSSPLDVAVNAEGTTIFVADYSNNRIRAINIASGMVSTFAGSGAAAYLDGNGTAAEFSSPAGVAVDASDNVYVADEGNNRIRIITPGGVVSTFAGSGTSGHVDATGTAAAFNWPWGITVANGTVYVTEFGDYYIREITSGGVVSTLAGSGSQGNANGTGTAASFYKPRAIAVDTYGNAYVADNGNNLIRMITSAGVVTTLAGSGTGAVVNGTGTAASFNEPAGIAIDSNNHLYVGDESGNEIREIQ